MSAAEKLATPKQRPILFSGPMVRAILEGRKTQTRRVVKVRKPTDHLILASPMALTLCPYGQPGDQLWVRETFVLRSKYERVYYRADHPVYDPYAHNGWRPSIFMPRKYSRITLEVTGIRVERLRDISEEDAEAEGVERADPYVDSFGIDTPGRAAFAQLWTSINSDRAPWASNPWVWKIEFKRVSP